MGVLLSGIFLLVFLCGYGKTEELMVEFSGEKMEGMEHLYAENE